MAYYEVRWDYPKYSGYSILNAAINPAICWNELQNNPMVKGFLVQYQNIADGQWITIGETNTDYIRFPSDVYSVEGVYRFRIASIGINGKRSAYSYNTYTLNSPLVFDFTSPQDVRLSNGTTVPNQRFIFLIL
jgi:hypothetical protein